jgi:exosome complex exonuclease DIS3/RRP44
MRIDDATDNTNLTVGIRTLNSLAKILKKRRIQDGALMLASTEVRGSPCLTWLLSNSVGK